MKKTLLSMLMAASLFSPLAMADTQQQKIDDITKMLQENPEVVDSLHESLTHYLAQQVTFAQVLEENHDYMYNNPAHSWFGAKNPKLTIVNFTDYSCPFCKKLDPVLEELTEKYPDDIKVVNLYVPLKEMQSNSNSASFALNVWENEPTKYAETNEMLIAKPGPHDSRSIQRIAKTLGLESQVGADAETDQILTKNYQLFNLLGIRGTPGMLMEGQIIPGYMPLSKLEPIVLDIMASKAE